MIQDHTIVNLLKTVWGRVRWVGHGRKPLETCPMRLGRGTGSVKTENRFHSNRRHHESSQARLDQAHAPPTTPRRTKAPSPITLRLRWGGKEVEKGVGRPQVAAGKSSMCAMRPATGPGTRLLAGRSEAAAAVSGSGAPRVSTLGTPERQRETEQKGGWVALRSTELLGCTGSPGWR